MGLVGQLIGRARDVSKEIAEAHAAGRLSKKDVAAVMHGVAEAFDENRDLFLEAVRAAGAEVTSAYPPADPPAAEAPAEEPPADPPAEADSAPADPPAAE